MQTFGYERPASLAEAVALLAEHGPAARPLAGGTDLIIRLRDRSIAADLVVDVKAIPEVAAGIVVDGARLVIGATTTMTEIAAHPLVRRRFTGLAEAAAVVGSVQIRNRATLAGNLVNASPAADTAPSLLVYDAVVVAAGPHGTRRLPLDELFVRSGVTTLRPAELVTAIELPLHDEPVGSVHLRRTRRRGHDLAFVTLACLVRADGTVRLAYGSVGPRPVLAPPAAEALTDLTAAPAARTAALDALFVEARPSPMSMRAGPDYRLAMLRVLGARAVEVAASRAREVAA